MSVESQRSPEQDEISRCWQMLENHGFPPEACGWPFISLVGELPNAIDCAIDCLVRQREDLLAEVLELRKRPDPSVIAAAVSSDFPPI